MIMRDDIRYEEVGAVRPMRLAVWRGWRLKCPSCGAGPMLSGYLKVRDSCAVCSEDLHHHRVDARQVVATLLATVLILSPVALVGAALFHLDAWIWIVGLAAGSAVLALYLLPRLKGVWIGYQWARRSHGFGDDG